MLPLKAASRSSTSRASAGQSGISPHIWRIDSRPLLVQFDVEKGEPVRNAQGFCIRCAPNEAGEAIGKVVDDPSKIGSRFEGYTNQEASERRFFATSLSRETCGFAPAT